MANTTSTSTTVETPTKLGEQVKAAFSGDNKVIEYAPNFLASLNDSSKQATNDINRSALLLFLSITVFQLIAEAAVTEVSLGPFKLSNMTLIQKALPAAVAYFTMKIMFLSRFRTRVLLVHDQVVAQVYKPISEHNLRDYMTSPWGALTHPESVMSQTERLYETTRTLASFIVVLVLVLIGGFEIFAFYSLFQQFKLTDIPVWCSLAISAIFLIQAYSLFKADPNRA